MADTEDLDARIVPCFLKAREPRGCKISFHRVAYRAPGTISRLMREQEPLGWTVPPQFTV